MDVLCGFQLPCSFWIDINTDGPLSLYFMWAVRLIQSLPEIGIHYRMSLVSRVMQDATNANLNFVIPINKWGSAGIDMIDINMAGRIRMVRVRP